MVNLPFRVKLYDAFDHEWIDLGEKYHFATKEEAMKVRDEKNKEIQEGSLDHYGVIEVVFENERVTRGHEIDCPKNH